MPTVWITYAWVDNKERDVDYIGQQLEQAGLQVKLDRWNLEAGRRLWEQIADHITNPEQSDAWLFYATENSLGSEACKEEFSYALDRALNERGSSFPIIALFPESVDHNLIPPGIRTRLFVSMEDEDWIERIVAATERRQPDVKRNQLDPYVLTLHQINSGLCHFILEARPRAGTWSPFFFAIPSEDVERTRTIIGAPVTAKRGSKGKIPIKMTFEDAEITTSRDGKWVIFWHEEAATPSQSYFLFLNEIPTVVRFGVYNDNPQYTVKFSDHENPLQHR